MFHNTVCALSVIGLYLKTRTDNRGWDLSIPSQTLNLDELPFDSLSRIHDWIIPHRNLPRSALLVSADLLVCLTAIFRYLQALMCWKLASNVWFDYFRSVCTVGSRKMNWYLNVKGHEECVDKWTKKNQQEQQEWRCERERLGSWRKSEKVPVWLRYESRSELN